MWISFRTYKVILYPMGLFLLVSCSAPRNLNDSEYFFDECLIVISKVPADDSLFMSVLARSGYQPVIVNESLSANGFRILTIKIQPISSDRISKILDLSRTQNIHVYIAKIKHSNF